MKKLDLIDDLSSPLFRIMSVFDSDKPTRQQFTNNICAFHIGNGYILSVGHNLRTQMIPNSFEDTLFNSDLLSKVSSQDQILLNSVYILDSATSKRFYTPQNPTIEQQLINLFDKYKLDFRFVTLYDKKICHPYLIIQFKENKFYNASDYSDLFPDYTYFNEVNLNRHTFKIKLDFIEGFYEKDYAIYKINDEYKEVIKFLPSLELDLSFYGSKRNNYFCLQPAPADNLGRLLNIAKIDGIIEHYSTFIDPIGGNYHFEGYRYLISGYFRFGSSGSPYLSCNRFINKFSVNAIQSEACPLQLMINGNMNGNFQYVNGIASPIFLIKNDLKRYNLYKK